MSHHIPELTHCNYKEKLVKERIAVVKEWLDGVSAP